MKLSLNCRGICKNIGLVGNYEARTRVNVKLAKRKLMNMYSECWRENINARPKLEVYSTVKNTFETSGYVKALLTKKQRSLSFFVVYYRWRWNWGTILVFPDVTEYGIFVKMELMTQSISYFVVWN